MPRLSFLVSVAAGAVAGADSQETLIVSCWRETAGIVRGTFDHPHSGTSAYFQGNEDLVSLAEALRFPALPSADVRREGDE